MSTLVLLRHGQSQWNLENRFTGWTDVPLTEQGEKDAAKAAEVLKEFTFDIAFTSRLQRASKTLDIILDVLGQHPPIERDSALNERHYGDLQGLNKVETAEKYGQDQVTLWRRSYSTRPPNGESIEDVTYRVMPLFRWTILPLVQSGKNILVSASANSMRPIIQFFDGLTNDETATFEVPLVTPYIYTYEGEKLISKERRDVPGIVTLGASQTQKTIQSGRV